MTKIFTSTYMDGDFSFGRDLLSKESSVYGVHSGYFKIPCDRTFPYLEWRALSINPLTQRRTNYYLQREGFL